MQDSLIYLLLIVFILSAAIGLYKGGVHLAQLRPDEITLQELPGALMLSFLRMTVSFLASIVFAFTLGLLAARSSFAERIIIPGLDIMQSLPVIAFFPAAITFFIGTTGGSRAGIEMAACFLIFTSQAWNMAFAVYEAIKTIPSDAMDAVASFGMRGSQRFWKLYAPASVPRLVYNSILSWSNGWFFLVSCELITVGPLHFNLPGIGSFLARAAEQDEIGLVAWGLAALSSLVLVLDFFFWRPVSAWSERFRQDLAGGTPEVTLASTSRLPRFFPVHFIPRSMLAQRELAAVAGRRLRRMLKILFLPLTWLIKDVLLPLIWDLPLAVGTALTQRVIYYFRHRFALPAQDRYQRLVARARWVQWIALWLLGAVIGIALSLALIRWLRPPWPALFKEIPLALLASTLRLVLTLALSMAWILPLVLFTWDRPRLRQTLTTIAQVGASMPAIALFPLFILVAVNRFGGGMEVASILLLLTGMQWYILFNGLGGASVIPSDLREAVRGMGLSKAQTFRHLVIPAIRPSLITGAITAWGGGWNALIVSEYVVFKDKPMEVRGIGALLARSVYQLGDSRSIMICIAAMVSWIVFINFIVWRPLYQNAAERYRFDL